MSEVRVNYACGTTGKMIVQNTAGDGLLLPGWKRYVSKMEEVWRCKLF